MALTFGSNIHSACCKMSPSSGRLAHTYYQSNSCTMDWSLMIQNLVRTELKFLMDHTLKGSTHSLRFASQQSDKVVYIHRLGFAFMYAGSFPSARQLVFCPEKSG